MAPGICVLEGTNCSASYLDPEEATCHTGNTLDWFMVSAGLALSAETKADPDTPIYAHYPVRLRVGGILSEDMGQRIRRPMAFQGVTKKEARTGNIPEGDFATIE
eukprot:10508902-Heterocapsa_arctica.AAC.1